MSFGFWAAAVFVATACLVIATCELVIRLVEETDRWRPW